VEADQERCRGIFDRFPVAVQPRGKDGRLLTEVDLAEVSVTSKPVVASTRILSWKATDDRRLLDLDDDELRREIDRLAAGAAADTRPSIETAEPAPELAAMSDDQLRAYSERLLAGGPVRTRERRDRRARERLAKAELGYGPEPAPAPARQPLPVQPHRIGLDASGRVVAEAIIDPDGISPGVDKNFRRLPSPRGRREARAAAELVELADRQRNQRAGLS
jgi:hypothetical protein